jgi:hypothetical protein
MSIIASPIGMYQPYLIHTLSIKVSTRFHRLSKTKLGLSTCSRGFDVVLVLRDAQARAIAVGPRWRNREPAPSIVVLADKVVVVERSLFGFGD